MRGGADFDHYNIISQLYMCQKVFSSHTKAIIPIFSWLWWGEHQALKIESR